MSVKDKLTVLLYEKQGEYISGQEIAQSLGVSRSAVWKAVKELQGAGYAIDAVTNKGYCLKEENDVLSADAIKTFLRTPAQFDIQVFPVIDSTNTKAMELAKQNAPEGTVVIAGAQTAGRGRRGRSFFSPSDTGVYISLVLRPKTEMSKAVFITTAAAVAVCRAIEAMGSYYPQIKWVNDVFLNGKKVSGILTEAAMNLEDGTMDYAVVGIGVNAYAPKEGFPQDIENVAGAVFERPTHDVRNKLAALILQSFIDFYHSSYTSHTQEYRKRCFVIGRQVKILQGETSRSVKVLDVDENCHLVVENQDGTQQALQGGEISLRF